MSGYCARADKTLEPMSSEWAASFVLVFFFFFAKIFDGVELKNVGPRRSLTGTKSDGGGTCERKLTEAETAHLMQN